MKLRPKKPSTIVGTPAIVSRIGFTIVRTRVDAYSARKTAARRPSGTAMSSPMPATSSVPEIERQDAPRLGLDQRRPVRAGEELDRADLGEELEGLERQDRDDPDGRQRRRAPAASEEQALDDPLAQRAAVREGGGRCGHRSIDVLVMVGWNGSTHRPSRAGAPVRRSVGQPPTAAAHSAVSAGEQRVRQRRRSPSRPRTPGCWRGSSRRRP